MWVINYFLKRHLVREAEAAESDRTAERKKSFWGKRKIKMPRAPAGSKESGAAEGEKLTNTRTLDTGAPSEDSHGAFRREQGDDYADERDAGPLKDNSGESGIAGLVPHPHFATHFNRPTWVKECWEDIRVGDFVRLRGDESVPAGEFYTAFCVHL